MRSLTLLLMSENEYVWSPFWSTVLNPVISVYRANIVLFSIVKLMGLNVLSSTPLLWNRVEWCNRYYYSKIPKSNISKLLNFFVYFKKIIFFVYFFLKKDAGSSCCSKCIYIESSTADSVFLHSLAVLDWNQDNAWCVQPGNLSFPVGGSNLAPAAVIISPDLIMISGLSANWNVRYLYWISSQILHIIINSYFGPTNFTVNQG